jgi:hypothetical protein
MEILDPSQFFLLRLLERLIGVGIGGLAIYFGYRLFVLLPTEQNNRGKITLPGISVVLAKVGPGVFFAAFGALIVYQSFAQSVAVKSGSVELSGAVPQPAEPGPAKIAPPVSPKETRTDTPVAPDQIAPVRQAVQMLNCLQRQALKPDSGLSADEVEEPIRLAKIALLESIWSTASWGTVEAFIEWTIMGIGRIDPVVREIFQGDLAGCPP